MKKAIYLLMAAILTIALVSCGAKTGGEQEKSQPAQSSQAQSGAEQTGFEWTRKGFYQDGNDNMLSISYSDIEGYEGWMVAIMLGGDIANSHGNILPQQGNTLHGNIIPEYQDGEMIVTVSEEGEDGVMLTVEGGQTYHFTPMEMPEATIFVSLNTEGMGNVDHAEGEEAPEIDEEYPYQSAQINLAEPATYTFVAWTKEDGWAFKKWTKNGEDFAVTPQVTVLLDESAEYVAVFEAK